MSDTYSVPDFAPIAKELHEVLSDLATTKAQAFTKLAEELEKNMKAPNWTIETLNQVEGTIGRAKLSQQCAITFAFNGDELVRPPLLDEKEKAAIGQLAQDIGGESEGGVLAQVVAESVEPQVVGKMVSAQALSMFVLNAEGKKSALALAPSGYCLLKPVAEAVLIDYSLMLAPRDPNGQLLFVLDEEVFAQHIYVAKALLENRKSFKQRYQWDDTTHGKHITITVDAQFSPHA